MAGVIVSEWLGDIKSERWASSVPSYRPARTRIKAGTTVTFTNVGDLPYDATSLHQGEWGTGALAKVS